MCAIRRTPVAPVYCANFPICAALHWDDGPVSEFYPQPARQLEQESRRARRRPIRQMKKLRTVRREARSVPSANFARGRSPNFSRRPELPLAIRISAVRSSEVRFSEVRWAIDILMFPAEARRARSKLEMTFRCAPRVCAKFQEIPKATCKLWGKPARDFHSIAEQPGAAEPPHG